MESAKDYNTPRTLLENGANLFSRNIDGESPIHTFFGPVVEQILLSNDYLLDRSARDSRGRNLLHYLAWSSKTSCETFERIHARSGRAIDLLDEEKISVLHLAAQRCNIALVKYILMHTTVDVNAQDQSGRTPLHYSVKSKRASSVIALLVLKGADVSAKDRSGRSALHAAATLDRIVTIQALLEAGLASQLGDEDHYGQTPVQIAANHKAQQVHNYLHSMFIAHDRDLKIDSQEAISRRRAPQTWRDPGALPGCNRKMDSYHELKCRHSSAWLSRVVRRNGAKVSYIAWAIIMLMITLSVIWLFRDFELP